MKSQNHATAKQVIYFRGLFAAAGVTLASSRMKKFKALGVGQASLAIQAAILELDDYALSAYVAPAGMATSSQLTYFMKLSRRRGLVPTADEIAALKALSTVAMKSRLTVAMRDLQTHNDAHGVPLPAWRRDRGLYDSEHLRDGQRAAAQRQAERRAEVQQRIAKRQESKPSRERILYPGEDRGPKRDHQPRNPQDS